jgi:hypothetical protein
MASSTSSRRFSADSYAKHKSKRALTCVRQW